MLVPVYLTLILPQKQLPSGILLARLMASESGQKMEVNWLVWYQLLEW
jgi:hypothetical protein